MTTEQAVAFGLREEYAGTVTQFETEEAKEAGKGTEVDLFTGGLLHVGTDGEELDVKAALEAGDGVIVVDPATSPILLTRLDEYPALKRVPVPAGAAPLTGGYADRTAAELRDELKRRGITGAGSTAKPELVTALEHIDTAGGYPDGTTIAEVLEDAAAEDNTNGEEA